VLDAPVIHVVIVVAAVWFYLAAALSLFIGQAVRMADERRPTPTPQHGRIYS
jgi:hypothetical protein